MSSCAALSGLNFASTLKDATAQLYVRYKLIKCETSEILSYLEAPLLAGGGVGEESKRRDGLGLECPLLW